MSVPVFELNTLRILARNAAPDTPDADWLQSVDVLVRNGYLWVPRFPRPQPALPQPMLTTKGWSVLAAHLEAKLECAERRALEHASVALDMAERDLDAQAREGTPWADLSDDALTALLEDVAIERSRRLGGPPKPHVARALAKGMNEANLVAAFQIALAEIYARGWGIRAKDPFRRRPDLEVYREITEEVTRVDTITRHEVVGGDL